MNLEKLSKPELLTLFSILEGELEARDLVIEALKVSYRFVSCIRAQVLCSHLYLGILCQRG